MLGSTFIDELGYLAFDQQTSNLRANVPFFFKQWAHR
jgi:hypothetical protein